MLLYENYSKILKYFDKELGSIKEDSSGKEYYELVLQEYFDSSILSIDYMSIDELFKKKGEISFVNDKSLSHQYLNLSNNKWLQLLENILNILNHATIYKEKNNIRIEIISSILKRNDIKVINLENRDIEMICDDILDSGSYCNIVKLEGGILKKQLKPIYQNDDKLKKRLRYEFENMKKLEASPQVLNVFDFDTESNTYLMQQGEMNLYTYLASEKEIDYDLKIKIIMDILEGMSFAHENSIIHRDLHLGNILKFKNNFVICDFGLSKDLSRELSMKTSYTAKNNHIFVDPIAFTDFTKLDMKSDIYSIGKIIEFILQTNNKFKPIIEKCICMDREIRYSSIKEIIRDIDIITREKNKEQSEKEAIQKILNNQYDVQVHQYILNLLNLDELNKFIVKYNLNSFANIILQFESPHQYRILNNISVGYLQATGFNNWSDYDIFARISYTLCINSEDIGIKKVAKNILTGCAGYRFDAEKLLEKLDF